MATCMRNTHTHTLPFYSPLSGLPRVGWYQKRLVPGVIILDFKRREEDNRGKWQSGWMPLHRDHRSPHLRHPPVLRWMPFLSQSSQFILTWDRHQICWIECESYVVDEYGTLIGIAFSASNGTIWGHLRQPEVPEIWLACCAISVSVELFVDIWKSQLSGT